MIATTTTPTRRKITPPQYAAELGVEPSKVIAWIKSGELRAMNAAERSRGQRPRYLIDRADIQAFELARSAPATKATPRRQRQKKQRTDEIEFF